MKLFYTRILSFTAYLMLLSSCTHNDLKEYHGRPGMFTMRPVQLGDMPNGDDSYSQAVRDGCNTAIAIGASGPMASQYDDTYYNFDKIAKDSDYYKGLIVGWNYCTYFQNFDVL